MRWVVLRINAVFPTGGFPAPPQRRKPSGMENDPYLLARFVDAQEGIYATALAELRRGAKTSHWMWFVFPQIAGLGTSATSRHYAIRSLGEARAYLGHPLLGPRLAECTAAVLAHDERSAAEIFGTVDADKLRSSMTLFAQAAEDGAATPFVACLATFFDGQPDEATLRILEASQGDEVL